MEPWLEQRRVNTTKSALILSPNTERTLSELSKITERFLQTMGSDFWHDPYVSALQYYFSIVPAIVGAQKAYPYFCGQNLDKDAVAVSLLLNPDFLMGLKEPLLRYAKAMPTIAKSTVKFPASAEYSLFIFCYRTLVFVLEELLLAIPKINVKEAFFAIYELDSSFEALRLNFLRCSPSDDSYADKVSPGEKTLLAAADRCVNALRNVSKEFYAIEMLILKHKHPPKNGSMSSGNHPGRPSNSIDPQKLSELVEALTSREKV